MYVCIYVKKNSQGDFRLMSFTAGRCSTPLIFLFHVSLFVFSRKLPTGGTEFIHVAWNFNEHAMCYMCTFQNFFETSMSMAQ